MAGKCRFSWQFQWAYHQQHGSTWGWRGAKLLVKGPHRWHAQHGLEWSHSNSYQEVRDWLLFASLRTSRRRSIFESLDQASAWSSRNGLDSWPKWPCSAWISNHFGSAFQCLNQGAPHEFSKFVLHRWTVHRIGQSSESKSYLWHRQRQSVDSVEGRHEDNETWPRDSSLWSIKVTGLQRAWKR